MRLDHCVPSNFISAWPHGNWGHRSSWSKKGSGLHVPSSPLRHWIYYKKFALYLCFKTSSTQEIGVIPLLWHHMWPPPRNIGLIFSSLETHSLPWETKRNGGGSTTIWSKIMFPFVPLAVKTLLKMSQKLSCKQVFCCFDTNVAENCQFRPKNNRASSDH